jgi:AcrR family transcriptional regulator
LSQVESQTSPDFTSPIPLPQTARTIIDAAKNLVAERGFSSLTMKNVEEASGINKGAIWYIFGGKEGLVDALVHDIVLEECAFVAKELPAEALGEERVESLLAQARHTLTDPQSFAGGFDIVAYSYHRPRLRQQWARMYEIWFETNLERLGVPPGQVGAREHAQVAAAIVDGLALQQLLELPTFDPEKLLASMRVCLKALVEDLQVKASTALP